MAIDFDFEDNLIPSAFKNSTNRPWVTTSADANAGTYSMKAGTITADQSSYICIFINAPTGGTITFNYKVSSESGFDFGKIFLNVATPIVNVSGAGSWVSDSATLRTGLNLLVIGYEKDGSGDTGDDTFYVDDIGLPNDYTDYQSDVEFFPSGVPASGWTNDGTLPYTAAGTGVTGITGLKSGGAANSTSTLSYTSDSGAPAGDVVTLMRVSSEITVDPGSVVVDSGTPVVSSGENRIPFPYVEAVSSGAHTVTYAYTKDNGVDQFDDALILEAFYEPDFTSASVTAAITGTMTDTVDEDDITTGGKTIIVTLVGDTWKAAGTGPIGSTADTQALIDGFDAASSPTNGWNNEVRDKALTSEVVRTSSTIATWTVGAQAGYDISAQETITGTIPTAALTTGAGALTATPTFTVDQVTAGVSGSHSLLGVGF